MEWSDEIGANGFAIRHDVLSADWIGQVLEDDIRRAHLRSKAGLRHAMALGSVRYISGCDPIRRLACEVLGPRAYPFRATIFDKSSSANWLVSWHQDTALPLRHRTDVAGWSAWSVKQGVSYAHAPASVMSQVLALRIHLDDSTSENGPLRVLPGTHDLGLLTDDRIHELSERTMPVECIASRGGVVAMRPLLVHASSKSYSEMPRRVLHIEYAASQDIASPLELEVA